MAPVSGQVLEPRRGAVVADVVLLHAAVERLGRLGMPGGTQCFRLREPLGNDERS